MIVRDGKDRFVRYAMIEEFSEKYNIEIEQLKEEVVRLFKIKVLSKA